MVRLSPEQQATIIHAAPGVFRPAAGAWGRGGATTVRFASVDEETLGEAMTLAWQNVINKAAGRPARKPGKKRAKKPARKTTIRKTKRSKRI